MGSENGGLISRAKEILLKEMHSKSTAEHPIVGGDFQVNLDNFMNFQYTGPMWMGSEPEQVQVIYDTGSDYLLLETDFCPSCI